MPGRVLKSTTATTPALVDAVGRWVAAGQHRQAVDALTAALTADPLTPPQRLQLLELRCDSLLALL